MTIVDEIRTAVASDPAFDHPTRIAVSERAGAVTLRGTVPSPHQRREAVRIAKGIPGVRSVDDQLHIDPRDHFQDDQLRGVALQSLMSDDSVPADRVDVKVANGWLTLRGEVTRQSDSDAAFASVAAVPGLGGITNEIKVITAGIDG